MSERGANSHQNFSGIFPSRTKRFSFRLKKAINFREERVVLNPLFVYPCKWSALLLFETHPPSRFLFPEGPQVLALNKVLAQFGIENYLSVHLSHAPAFRKPNCREGQPAGWDDENSLWRAEGKIISCKPCCGIFLHTSKVFDCE